MPTVRPYGQRRVQKAALPGARLPLNNDPNAFGAGLGNTVAKFGEAALTDIAQVRAEKLRKEKLRMDEIAVIAARNKLDAFENELLNGQQGLMRRKGEDAFAAYDNFEATYNATADEIGKGLANEDQQLAYLRARSQRFDSASTALRKHIAAESERFDEQESNKLIENISQSAMRSFMSPRDIGIKLGEADAAVSAFADRNGLGKEQTEAMKREVTSKIHEGVLNNMLAAEKPEAARLYFEAVEGQLDASRIDDITKALQVGSVRKQSQQKADEIVKTAKTQTEALEEVRQIEDAQLRDETEQRVMRFYSQKRVAEQQDQEQLVDEVANILDRTNGNLQAIPAAVWSKMSMSQRNSAEVYANKKRPGASGGGEKGLLLWTQLREEAAMNPGAFKARNLRQLVSSLDETEYKDIVRLQQDMREGKATAQKTLDDARTFTQIVDGTLADMNIPDKVKTDTRSKLQRRVGEKSQEYIRKNNKEPSNDDLQRFADEAAREEVVIKGKQTWDFNPFNNADVRVPAVNLKATDIPSYERKRIESKLRSLGIAPSDREVLQFFVDENRVK